MASFTGIGAGQEGSHQADEEAVRLALGVRFRCRVVLFVGKEFAAHPGREDQCHGERNQHAHARVDRDRAHIRSHQPGDEGHRQQGGDHGERRQDGGSTHLIDRDRNDVGEGSLAGPQMPMDVLYDHDGVIDQDADREDQREQGDSIDREPPGPGREQGCRQGDDHGRAHDHCFALAHREEYEEDDGGGREQELFDQLGGLVIGGYAVVAGHRHFDTRRDGDAFQLHRRDG